MIIVDNRERASSVPMLLEKLGISLHYANLETGDYLLGDDICIERKTIGVLEGNQDVEEGDFLTSLFNGRLHNQLYKMSYTYSLSYLAIIGYPSIELEKRCISRDLYISSVVGATFKRAIEGKQGFIGLLQFETVYDFALALKYLHQKYIERKPRLPTIPRDAISDKDRLVFVLSSFPNVGEVNSKKLLSQFKTISNICNATPQQLGELLGEKRGLEFYLWLHKVYEENKEEVKI